MSDKLKLDLGAGDNLFVRELYQILWADRQNGGKGLTFGELKDQARLKWNTSAACQWYEQETGSPAYAKNSTRSDSQNVEFSERTIRVDRADREWIAVVELLFDRTLKRMLRNLPGSSNGQARDRLVIAGNRPEGRPRLDAPETRYAIHIVDGRPILPRYYRAPQHLPGQWLDFDPEAERIGMASHLDVIAWLSEARAEQKRPKPRPVELAALVDRAIALLSVSGS